MPSTFLLFGLLLLYTVMTGRMTALINGFKELSDSGLFSKKKLTKETKK